MAFAIFQTGGKQYRVSEGDIVSIEKIEKNVGDAVDFPMVVLFSSDDVSAEIGAPFLSGKVVKAEVLEQGKADKIRVVHKKPKKRMLRMKGHRQPFTKLKITSL